MERNISFVSKWIPVKLLGEGSYGVVFLAVPTIGTLDFVALKVAFLEYSSSLMMEKDVLENFVGCPEIVQCIGSEVYSGNNSVFYNLVLEYAAGGTLANLITQRGKLRESEVKEYLKMILRGLSRIHNQGFVHGDLKPANILVFPKSNGKMQLKIADFGLSKRCDERQEVVECCNVEPKFRGTPIYMSPESVVFGNVNPPLDIWSLGCILVEMVSGKSVWGDCKNREQLMKKLVYEMEIPNIPEELSREGRDFLARCFDQNSKRRWTADMLLKHPYLKEEQKVDEMLLIFEMAKLLKEEPNFRGSCFHQNSEEKPQSDVLQENLFFNHEQNATEKGNEKPSKPSVQPEDDQLFRIANLIGFNDFVL